ncbi:hypothetical protein HNQ56_003299 [Anaerotaenia torta]
MGNEKLGVDNIKIEESQLEIFTNVREYQFVTCFVRM